LINQHQANRVRELFPEMALLEDLPDLPKKDMDV
jgi:hypothetical protein